MNLIIKRINADTSLQDLENFLESSVSGGFLRKSGKIDILRIQAVKELDSGLTQFQALISISPESVAKRVIKKLNRKPCQGKPVNVLEYHYRLHQNDRRQNSYHVDRESRVGDRRRKNLEIKDISDKKSNHNINFNFVQTTS